MNASSRTLCELSRPRFSAVGPVVLSAMIVVQLVLQCGCVALNIPSQRHHDPSDHGGVLGSWEDPVRPGRVLKEIIVGPSPTTSMGGCDDAYLDPSMDSFEGNFDDQAPPAPEVPWPKYHPVPTRPVFGG